MASEPIHEQLQQVLVSLRSGNLERAHAELHGVLQRKLNDPEVLYILAGVNFWREKVKVAEDKASPLERGEALVSQWKNFLPFMRERGEDREPVLYALKRCAFSIALGHYLSLYREDAPVTEPELCRKVGLCYKALGDYERALSLLDKAKDGDRESAPILAELADCYALCGEMRYAKVFFREAFFKDASKIELCFLESEIIVRLAERVEAMGYKGEEIAEWIPVYGLLFGVFSVKRALKSVEIGKLKQNIFSLKEELKSAPEKKRRLLVPRLINHYFWLIDHFVSTGSDRTKINEILLEIKLLDENIYEKYTL